MDEFCEGCNRVAATLLWAGLALLGYLGAAVLAACLVELWYSLKRRDED
jgi:hypothetical protein